MSNQSHFLPNEDWINKRLNDLFHDNILTTVRRAFYLIVSELWIKQQDRTDTWDQFRVAMGKLSLYPNNAEFLFTQDILRQLFPEETKKLDEAVKKSREERTAVINSRVTMDIYSPRGSKIKFIYPDSGLDGDIEVAKNHLTIGQIYTVNRTIVHGSVTFVYLTEVPDIPFNSVQFVNDPPYEKEEKGYKLADTI